jgi:sodium/pantothenate symporter
MLRFSRWIMLLVGAITLVISLFLPPNIFWLTYYVGTVFASSWGPVAFMSIWSDSITARAAYWGISTGFAGNMIPRLLDTLGWIDLPSYLDPILIGGVISLVVVVGLSRKGSVTDVERAQRLTLREMPADERDARQVRWTQGAAIAVAACGVLLSWLLIVFYVMPFQEARGVLLEGDRLDWSSGEALLALAWAALYVPCGVGACWVIGRSYGHAERRR